MEKPNIILTGFMGTGKTTVGKLLAKQLKYDFVDTDELIQERAGKSIPEIFQEEGEAVFRVMESAIARELSYREGLVISTGGRLMLDHNNAEALSRTGRVFCMIATPEEIFKRVSNDPNIERPLLTVPNPMQRIVELLHQRKEGYAQFTQIETTNKTPDVVIKKLLATFQSNLD
jgi:shikimate kinase